MSKKERFKANFMYENEELRAIRKKESKITRNIVRLFAILFVVIVIGGGLYGYYYVSNSLKPVDTKQTQIVEVEIPAGSSVKQISKILEDNKLIRNSKIFNFYIKFKNVAGFKAGFYQLSPSMDIDQILGQLADGGKDKSANVAKVVVREGETLTGIAEEVEKSTKYSKEDFMNKVQEQGFIDQLVQKFPRLFKDAQKAQNVRYFLEGYLFPATYEADENKTLQMIIEEMVAKTDSVLSKYYAKISQGDYNVHEILTMASLLEKEGYKVEDRKKIASVFYNRIKKNMMLQTDISVLYALGEHKEVVTLKDLEVNSPYNLYKYRGLGPGPFNSPSEEAILAAIDPAQTDYEYFVADIKTKEVYFAKTYEEHLALKAKYVDKE